MSPKDDIFLSTGNDKQMLLWDLRNRKAIGRLDYKDAVGSGMVAFDPSGVCFALAYSTVTNGTENFIKLFDARNYADGPFSSWSVPGPEIKGIEFSSDGNKALVYTTENHLMILDSING